jgi:hypothetical protein
MSQARMSHEGLVIKIPLRAHQLTDSTTPLENVFTLAHFGIPEIQPGVWTVSIDGMRRQRRTRRRLLRRVRRIGYFGIEPGDDARKRREKIAGKIYILDRALGATLPYLFALLGIVEGEDPLAMDGQVKKAHAGRDQAHPAAREPQSTADGDL